LAPWFFRARLKGSCGHLRNHVAGRKNAFRRLANESRIVLLLGGDPWVNVLRLNLAFDTLASKRALAEKKP
jgi:hypothetical protein